MEKKDYDIKVVGEKNSYGDGAIRYVKNKGRFDLIPPDVLGRIKDAIVPSHYYYTDTNGDIFNDDLKAYIDPSAILADAFMAKDDEFPDIIIRLALSEYSSKGTEDSLYEITIGNNDMHIAETFTAEIFECICKLLMDLGIHFQKGAEKYGERNCEKGIPAWSFRDSGLRHLTQYMKHTVDGENHFIAAIWNFWMLDWTTHKDDANESEDDNSTDKTNVATEEAKAMPLKFKWVSGRIESSIDKTDETEDIKKTASKKVLGIMDAQTTNVYTHEICKDYPRWRY